MRSLMSKLLVLTLLALLVGCGADSSESDGGDGDDTTSEDVETVNLAVGTGVEDNFQEGTMETDISELSAGGSTRLSFNIVNTDDENSLFSGQSLQVAFSSPCLSATDPKAELDGPLEFEIQTGEVSVRYTAKGCVGEEGVTARVTTAGGGDGSGVEFSTQEVSTVLQIAPPTDLSISSSTPEPESLAPINNQTDTRGSVSAVEFTVRGDSGSVVPDQEVNFQLQFQGPEGPGAPTLEENSQTSSGSGTVTARVTAGTGNTIVRVIATLASNPSIQTASLPIAINRSLPAQSAFSISVSDALPNAWDIDGQTSDITIRAADNFGNNSGNAIVSFVTSGGAIEGDCVLDNNGECTVTWRSQNPRPDDGRVTIMARTVGEESFTDENGNGLFDQGEPFVEAPGEAFLDRNQDGGFDPDEDLFDEDGNGDWTPPDGDYNGGGCPEDAGFCTKGPLTIWQDVTGFWMASDNLDIQFTQDPSPSGGLFCVQVQGLAAGSNRTPPPSGTTIGFQLDSDGDGEITSSGQEITVDNAPTSQNFVEFCVNAVGPGTLNAVATPPGDSRPVEIGTSLDAP